MNIRTITLALAVIGLCAYTVSADVPNLINFQGTLTDAGGNPITGTRSIVFSIYDQETVGTELWTETQPSVEIADGWFLVTLGSVNPLLSSIFTGEILWLEINVAGEILSPRTRVVSTPYGFRAAYADTSEYSRVGAPDDDWTFSGTDIYRLTGDVGIGTDSLVAKLHVTDPLYGTYGYLAAPAYGAFGSHSNNNYGYLGSASYGAYGKHYGMGNYGYLGSNTCGVYGKQGSLNNYGYIGGTVYGVYGQHNGGNWGTIGNATYGVSGTNSNGNVGQLGGSTYGARGTHTSTGNWGYIGGSTYGAYGTHYNTGNTGYLGSNTYGVYGIGSDNWGYIGSATYGVYGTNSSTGNWGYIGSDTYGVYGRHQTTGNFGCLGDTSYGVRGAHTASSNVGYLGSATYGASGSHNISGNYGYFGSATYGAYGTHASSGNWGNLGDANYGVYGRHHTTGNYGALGDTSYGVKGRHQVSANLGYLGSASYGAYGTHNSSGNYGYLGSWDFGVYGTNYSTGNYGFVGGPTTGVYGNSSSYNGYGGFFYGGGTGGTGIYAQGGTGGLAATFRGNVVIQGAASGATILELGEGLDYAEEFDVTPKEDITSGAVLIIDPDNPGKLTLSHQPYDSRVAGIVAGAKGLGSGVRLGTGQFDHNVALAGRVYCNVDASETNIEPGDLLTTSSFPGYAMKVTDYARTQGAILGKAMERLEKGQKGQILVLVTLQ